MCNSEKLVSTTFWREVSTTPELSLILAIEKDFNDIKWLETKSPFTVLVIDPKFNIQRSTANAQDHSPHSKHLE